MNTITNESVADIGAMSGPNETQAASGTLTTDDVPQNDGTIEQIKAALPDRSDFCCQICLELMFQPVVTNCQHKFCLACLEDWWDTGSHTCPTCRRTIPDVIKTENSDTVALMKEHFASEYATLESTAPERARVRDIKIHERQRAERELATAVKRVKSHFQEGYRMETEAVEVLLDMFGGNSSEVINFLSVDHAPASTTHLVTLRELDNGNARIPRDFYDKCTDQAHVDIPSPVQGTARDIATVLLGTASTFDDHVRVQKDHRAATVDLIQFLIDRGVLGTMTTGAKARALACCWARRDSELGNMLLSTGLLAANPEQPDVFGIPEVLKAMKLLDTGRLIRQLRKRLSKLGTQGNCKKRTLGKIQNEIDNLERERVTIGSLSGSLTKYIRKVVAKIPKAKLEYYAIQMPTGPWREIADLLHLNPRKGTQCDWFMDFAYGAPTPAGSVVNQAKELESLANDETAVAKFVCATKLPYSVLRQKLPFLGAVAKNAIAKYIPLNQLLWWYEELETDGLEGIILGRMRNKESPSLPYGKMMERLMLFERLGKMHLYTALLPIAEQRLRDIKLNLDRPVAVLGDASFSMDVAIRTATILSSLMAVISDADLSFFHTVASRPVKVPKTAAECVAVASATKTLGQTAPAAALFDYYQRKDIVKCFVVVSDEGENLKSNGFYFHELFRKYYTEVYPAKIVFVSFLAANEQGQMATALERMGFGPVKFSFDKDRPDLTKLDALLGTLAVTEL